MSKRKLPFTERLHEAAVALIEAEARRLAEAGIRVRAMPGNELLRGRIAYHLGHLAEERVVRLLKQDPRRPPWLLDARLASAEEDAQGVDVVVSTADAGDLALQVKISQDGVASFLRWHKPLLATVGVVIAPTEAADADVWVEAIRQLTRLREAAEPPRRLAFG